MLPQSAAPRKRRPGRPSKALLAVVPPERCQGQAPQDIPPVAPRRRQLLALYRRCLTVHARLLAQAEELIRVEVLLQRFLAHDLASVLSTQDVNAVAGLLGDVSNEDESALVELINQLTAVCALLRETHLP